MDDLSKRQRRLRDEQKIQNYRALSSKVLENKVNRLYNDFVFKQTTALLAENPEFYTIWNYRRDIITNHYVPSLPQKELISLFEEELKFIMFKLKDYPKVYWIWNHRRWTLENHPVANWEFELKIVSKLLSQDSRNYHGWHYRRSIIKEIEKSIGKSLALQEFHYTTEMINSNFSNFSAWHNRSKLIPVLLKSKPTTEFDDVLSFLKKELYLLKNAIYTDPEDQSAWIYLRWLLTDDIFVTSISKGDYIEILSEERANIKELNELEKDDNNGLDNNWCLKTLVTIENLLIRFDDKNYQEDVINSLKKLIEADPLRKNMYIDRLEL
ncbi:hypothetical protein WICMUC_000669 [Wickerhamomyces mucosus]|uniref:Geranylgeranyl transferase type-2 subunit alpha n=1 Tax=Wickerhamomyces mucosus TaxID=1378264 RepID=A0A9P8TIS9_9ASCO|nr:hypothetical protein WICMUC_000669 [Wickerhamomyces mucosus]